MTLAACPESFRVSRWFRLRLTSARQARFASRAGGGSVCYVRCQYTRLDMTELPEPVQFYLAACDRISAQGICAGIESLSPVERVIFRAYVFDCDEQNGSLSQFFYNTDHLPEVAEDTARSLETIGTPQTAAVLRSAATVVCRPGASSFVGTWSGYLAQVDPDRHLESCISQMRDTGESVSDALQAFIINHRNELERRET